MIRILSILFFFFCLQNFCYASNKEKIVNILSKTNNISFNFIQTINGKDEKGRCTVKYPKKIFCEYDQKNNKILVSNGKSLVIKNSRQYYRYPIKKTPFEFLLDKEFLIKKLNSSKLSEVDDKYIFFQIFEDNNNINIFFSKSNYEIIGWQVEDIYQNLAVTFIFNTSINENIDNKIFKLPKID